MKLLSFQPNYHLQLIIIFLSLTPPSIAAPKFAKTGCNDACGNVTIPFPFGIGATCSINEWYVVDCNSSTPYLPSLNNLEVLRVDLENQTVVVSTPRRNINISSDCHQKNSSVSSQTMSIMDVGYGSSSSPFLLSKSHNKFVFEGCGIAIMMENGSLVTGCSSPCRNLTLSSHRNKCESLNIPRYVKSYSIKLTGFEDEDEDEDDQIQGGCGSAFLVDESSYEQNSWFSDQSLVPVSLLWTIPDSDQFTCCDLPERYAVLRKERYKVDILNSTPLDTWICVVASIVTVKTMEGNRYLSDGCNLCDNDEEPVTEECKRCQDSGRGYCSYDYISYVDGGFYNKTFICSPLSDYGEKSKTSLGVILGVSISMGVLFLVAITYMLYKVIKKTQEKRQRKRFFKRNGGLLLKQQEEADPSLVDKTILFTSRELEKATDNFNENRILGRGGQGTVYKGMLVDGRIVAVKKSKIIDESQLQQFINEVVILSQVNHRNVVKLLGCCLETEVPLLVSEFISNGTLYERLHNQTDEFLISLNMRFQIATEVAGALSYLHSATSIPIYHRDIKTTNILLDDKYRAKIADFGTSRFVSIEQTHLTTLVKGTFGYLDPEYFQSSQFTEKSDVYSFGVVLVELLTGEKPISLTRFGENRSLATHFMLAMEEGRVMSIFDALVIKEGNRSELLSLANLATRCLNLNGKYRPTMKEVAIELETIRTTHIPLSAQMTTSPVVYVDDFSMISYGESSSTFLSYSDSMSH